MKWIPDPTGRFPQRPYYEDGELDLLCEEVISQFLTEQHGTVLLPVPTDDLTILIEQDAQAGLWPFRRGRGRVRSVNNIPRTRGERCVPYRP